MRDLRNVHLYCRPSIQCHKGGFKKTERAGLGLEFVSADKSRNQIDFKSTSSDVETICLGSSTDKSMDGYSPMVPGSIPDRCTNFFLL